MKSGIDLSVYSSVEELARLLEQDGQNNIAAEVRQYASLDEVETLLLAKRAERMMPRNFVFSPGRFSGQGTYTPPEEGS